MNKKTEWIKYYFKRSLHHNSLAVRQIFFFFFFFLMWIGLNLKMFENVQVQLFRLRSHVAEAHSVWHGFCLFENRLLSQTAKIARERERERVSVCVCVTVMPHFMLIIWLKKKKLIKRVASLSKGMLFPKQPMFLLFVHSSESFDSVWKQYFRTCLLAFIVFLCVMKNSFCCRAVTDHSL